MLTVATVQLHTCVSYSITVSRLFEVYGAADGLMLVAAFMFLYGVYMYNARNP